MAAAESCGRLPVVNDPGRLTAQKGLIQALLAILQEWHERAVRRSCAGQHIVHVQHLLPAQFWHLFDEPLEVGQIQGPAANDIAAVDIPAGVSIAGQYAFAADAPGIVAHVVQVVRRLRMGEIAAGWWLLQYRAGVGRYRSAQTRRSKTSRWACATSVASDSQATP